MAKPFPHVVGPDGQPRYLAALPPHEDFGGFRAFATANQIIPRSEWRDIDLSPLGVPVLDQGQHGSCVGHGSTTAFWFAYLMAGGTVPAGGFSPTSLYALVNGGRDQGAIVSDAMTALMETGVALMGQYPESVIFDRQLSPAALAEVKATRKRFRAGDATHCASFDAIGSALMLGFPVSFGITIRSGFNNPGSDGLIATGGGVLGGHCLAGYGLKKLADGRWAVRTRNSWGARWAVGGNCLLVEDHFQGQWGVDAFAVRSAKPDPLDTHPAPVAR